MRVDITLQQLEAFAEVAKTSNFRAAASALHVSQPALSRTIRIVEDLAGARLFDRDTRHVELTPAGRELLPIALRILENFNSSFSELAQFLEGRNGHLTIAALPSIGVALLPNAIAEFRRSHPQVAFSFVEGPAELVRSTVDEGKADFGTSVRPLATMAARSSISRWTALATSTGCSSDLKARAKAPSTMPSRRRSKRCRTPNVPPPFASLAHDRIRGAGALAVVLTYSSLPGRVAERQTRTVQVRVSERT